MVQDFAEKESTMEDYTVTGSMRRENREDLMREIEPQTLVLIYSGKPVVQSLDADYPYYPDNQYRYLTGLTEADGLYAAYKEADGDVDEWLFIPRPDYDREKWTGILMRPSEAREISGIDQVLFMDQAEETLLPVLEDARAVALDGLQPDHQSWQAPTAVIDRMEAIEATDIAEVLARLRLHKKPWELELMKRAVDITRKGLNAILLELHPGMKEYEIAALFRYIVEKNGAELSFPTIAASGANGPILHYETNRERLRAGTLLLLDLGARYQGYAADVSRTYPVSGTFSTRQRKLYDVVLRVQEEMIEAYTIGTGLKELQQLTIDKYSKYLPKAGFPLPENGISQWYYHSIGHSLGMDTHDGVSRDLVLEPGMVITCEPGLYLNEYEIGIRIEDDILITENGPVNLTARIAKDPERIVELMR